MRRWFAIAVALGAIAACARWFAVGLAPSDLPRDFLPLVVGLSEIALRRFPAAGALGLWLIAVAVATSGALALFLAIKARGNEATLRLSIALGAGALAVAYFYLVLPYPIAGRPASQIPLEVLFALDATAYILWFVAMWQVVRVWRIFPQPISAADWERHVATFLESASQRSRKGWRRWIYRGRLMDPKYWEETSKREGLARYVWYGGNARHRARLFVLFESRALVMTFLAAAVACAALEYALRSQLPSLAPGHRPTGFIALLEIMLPGMYVWITGLGAAVLTHGYLEFHRKWGTDEDRRRIAWIYSTVFVGGVLFFAVFQGAFALFILVVLFALESIGQFDLGQLILVPIVVGFPLFALACIVSLVLSVLYRGAIDPRHAARRITVWGLLGIMVAVAFVILERAVAIKVTQWLSMPAEWGSVVAGFLAAGTIAPIRGTAERGINRLATHYLPPDFIATGERRTCVVAMSDLSGYTALSEADEKKALLLAALLQQKAARLCAARNGRVVKSMGDAVMLEFESAAEACAVLEDLHAQFPAAARALDLDPLPLHSGAHVGEVVVGPDADLYGQTVNLAARLQGQAGEGEIVVSDALARAAGLPPERLQSMGARTLKNVQEPVSCHRLTPRSAALPAGPVPDQESAQREAIST